ncbi:hypothetical protein FRC12_025236 [Ceratobasidium sp. 428]|nr:hypothetical protein FRC12_025236 [Ceratobasidium sp. 428]
MRRPLPTEEFTRALSSLRQDAIAPIAILKDLLDLGTAPENIPQIAMDSKIVPICMGLLQQHCTHSRIFGENDYGVICICLIALRIEVGLLQSIGFTFNDNDIMGYDGPRSNLRMMEDALSDGIADGYQDRKPDDPPDLFRTPVGLVHVPSVLTSDQAGRLLDYIHRERDSLLRARVSGTSNWDGWPFLFHALWERLVFGNNNKITKVALKLLDLLYRFMIVKPSAPVTLEHLVARIKVGMSPTDVVPAPVNPSDRQEIMKAYINRFTNNPDPPTMQLSQAFFNWVALGLDATQADLVVEFITTTCDRLWGVLEDMKTRERIELVQVDHGMMFATDLIVYLRLYLAGNTLMQLKFAKDITKILKQALLESDIISLIARILVFPTLSTDLETLSGTDKKDAEFVFNAFFKSMMRLASTMSSRPGPSDFFKPLLHDWLKGTQQIQDKMHKYNRATFARSYLARCLEQWRTFGSVLFEGLADEPLVDLLFGDILLS